MSDAILLRYRIVMGKDRSEEFVCHCDGSILTSVQVERIFKEPP